MTTKYGPAQLDPAEWQVLGYWYQGTSKEIQRLYNYEWEALSLTLTGNDYMDWDEFKSLVEFHDNDGCASCGTHFAYGAVVRYIGDGAIVGATIGIGGICAGTFGLTDKMGLLKKKAKNQARRDEARKAAEAFIVAHDLADVLELDHHITEDIKSRLFANGTISPKQVEFLFKLQTQANEREERFAERNAQLASTPDLMEGRQEITGKIISMKYVSSDYGDTLKMLVEMSNGNRVWGTVPRAINNSETNVGSVVSFTATIQPSNDDSHFGFFKRPTKATTTKEEVAV